MNLCSLITFFTANFCWIDPLLKAKSQEAHDVHILTSPISHIGKEMFGHFLKPLTATWIVSLWLTPNKATESIIFYTRMK